MDTGFWGETRPTKDSFSTNSSLKALEKELIAKSRSTKTQNAKFSFKNEEPSVAANVEPSLNPVVVNTIRLLTVLRKLKSNTPLTPFDNSLINRDSLSFLECSSQASGSKNCLSPSNVRQLLQRSIVLILVHSGYELTIESNLELLTDICASFIIKVCNLLRVESDTKYLKSENDFPDVVDRVFTQIGFPVSVLQHYESCLLAYRNNVMKDIRRRMSLSAEKSSLSSQSNSLLSFSQIVSNIDIGDDQFGDERNG